MIRLDDEEFVANSIIDLVVYPDMPVHTIVREMTRDAGFRIVLDTQGNLHPHYGSSACGEHRLAPEDCAKTACEAQRSCTGLPQGGASDGCGMPPEPVAGDACTSSIEHVSHLIDDSEDDRLDTRYHFVGGLHSLIQRLDEIRRLRDFVLVIDSITLVCDCSPFNLQHVINMLWGIVYGCNATVITINHYRVGRVRRTCRLVPRMGTRWAFFVTYQVLLSYRRNKMVFSIEDEKRTGAR